MITRDLQAIHQIVSVFEKSKFQSDNLLDTLPFVFSVIDQNGQILRGNRDTAALFDLSFENLIGKSFYSFFKEENLTTFFTHFDRVKMGEIEHAQFDLSIHDHAGNERIFVWDLSPFPGVRGARMTLFKIVGRDVTEFRKQVAQSTAVAKEMEVTKAIQTMLLPKEAQTVSSQFKLATYYQPAEQVGGDWWWYDETDPSSPLLLLADVSGHGVGAAMVTAILGASYHMIRQLTQGLQGEAKVQKIFEMIHLNLIETSGHDSWVCLSAVQVLREQNQIVYWNAGGLPLFIKRKEGKLDVLKQVSRPLVSSPVEMKPVRAPLMEGDQFFLFSDGVIDFEDLDGVAFNLNKLKRVFESYQHNPIQLTLDHVIKTLTALQRPGSPVNDDRTLVGMELIEHDSINA